MEQRVAVVGAHDVFVLDRPADVGLAEEALEEAGGLQEVGVDHLQGDRTTPLQARDRTGHLGPVDLAHAPGTQLIEKLVRPKSRSLHGG